MIVLNHPADSDHFNNKKIGGAENIPVRKDMKLPLFRIFFLLFSFPGLLFFLSPEISAKQEIVF